MPPDDTLTKEEIVSRFKKLFNRGITPEEQRGFFLDYAPIGFRRRAYRQRTVIGTSATTTSHA